MVSKIACTSSLLYDKTMNTHNTHAHTEKTNTVRSVFEKTAPTYDFMNDVLSLGLHRYWKEHTIAAMQLKPGDKVLDLAAGSCDLTLLLAQTYQDCIHITCADPCSNMLKQGKDKLLDQGVWKNIDFCLCSAETLPFCTGSFHAVTIGFGFRNFTDPQAALSEIFRILKPGGKLIILEFSKPKSHLIRNTYTLYSRLLIPTLGQWLTNNHSSYQYLVDSIEQHPCSETVSKNIVNAGFATPCCTHFLSGLVCTHKTQKPHEEN